MSEFDDLKAQLELDKQKRREQALKSKADWSVGVSPDVDEAKATGSAPFYYDWMLRPSNLSLWMSLQANDPNGELGKYDQQMNQHRQRVEKAEQEYQRANPKSGWFGL